MKKLICLWLSLMIILCSCGSGDTSQKPEDCLEALIDFSYRGDFSKVRRLAPDAYWEQLEKDTSMTYKEMVDLAKEKMEEENSLKNFEERYGKDYKLTYEVVGKEIPGDAELDDLKEDVLYHTGDARIKIDDAIKYDVEITVKGSKDEAKQKNDFLFVKCDGEWYIYFDGVGFVGIAVAMVATDFTWE